MKKLIIAMLVALMFVAPAFGAYGRKAYLVSIVDALHEKNADEVTSFEVKIAGSTTATIYANAHTTTAATNPIVDSSTATDITTLTDGHVVFWYAATTCDIALSDGTYSKSYTSVNPRNTRLMFDSTLYSAMSDWTLLDAETMTFGTSLDWVANGAANLMKWTPVADNSEFRIGVSGTSYNSDFNVYVGTLLGLKLDAGVPSLVWDGGAATLNHNSNSNVGLCTGTSTGAVSIGSATAGTVAVDTTAGITVNADDSYALTVSAGTIGIAATGGDITVDGVDSSVIIRGTEAIADAIWIDADAGGADITTAATFDIDLTATGGKIIGTASENAANTVHLEANGGTSESINIYSNQGTGSSAATQHDASIQLHSDDGGISLYTTGDVADAISLEANAGTSETIRIHANQGTAATEGSASIQLLSDVGGINVKSNLDNTNAVLLTADGGTSATIVIHNDQGTGGSSIHIDSDDGSIDVDAGDNLDIDVADDVTVDTADGSVAITAAGANNGDVTITVADDYSLDVTGVATYKGALYADSRVSENHSANHTLTDPTNIGTLITVDTAAVVITLPAVSANATYTIMNIGADGTEIHVDTNANDKFLGGCEFAAALDDGDKLTNTGATADKGDYVTVIYCDATGWLITEMNGTWADGGA